ncbi:50S ribosomal protein L9 [Thiolapillus sp.]|uniref:50S ribosomal protein L9 n=1 Tax=Thiolapillus sp. TaxID=2017437 RepID=UPI0025D716CC|nr:50S ribosomal protein L9 [Thiolapillus sp.]
MEVILLDKISGLGDLGDKVAVKPGYGRNFLIPGGKAIPATKDNLVEFEKRRAELEKDAAEKLSVAESRKAAVEALEGVTISHKAGEEGKLFGSVGTADISRACTEAGVAIEKNEIRLPDGPMRATGDFDVVLHLHPDVNATLKVVIVAEE